MSINVDLNTLAKEQLMAIMRKEMKMPKIKLAGNRDYCQICLGKAGRIAPKFDEDGICPNVSNTTQLEERVWL